MANNLIPITTGLTFKTTKFKAAYAGMKEAYDKAASAVSTAGNAVEEYSKTMGVIFARLTTDKNGKLDPDKNEGFKSVGEFAEKCGIKASTAYAWRNHALARQNEHLPDEIKNLPTSTFAALQSSLKRNEAEVINAFKNHELSATSTQDEVRKWAKEHKPADKAQVVTEYSLHDYVSGKNVEKDYDMRDGEVKTMTAMGTLDELKAHVKTFSPAAEVIDIPAVKVIHNLTNKEVTAKRFIVIRPADKSVYGETDEGRVNVYIAVPIPKDSGKKPIQNGQDLNRKAKWTEAVQKAKALGLSDEAITDLLSDLYPEFYK